MDHETLRIILNHADTKARALILTLASSGMRIGEALQLQTDDVFLNQNPVEIRLRGEYTKTGEQRITFITTEAAMALREWLKVRDSYLDAACNRNKGLVKKGIGNKKERDDTRLFPFSDRVVNQLWENILDKAQLHTVDRGTGRKQLHIHMLRKFFRSQLALLCPVDVVEILMGHSGYLTDAYRRYTKKQLAELYLKGESQLTIQTPKEIKEIEGKLQARMEDQGIILEQLQAENAKLKLRLQKQEEVDDRIIAENAELKQSFDRISKISMGLARIINIVQRYPGADEVLREITTQWREEILAGAWGPQLRDEFASRG